MFILKVILFSQIILCDTFFFENLKNKSHQNQIKLLEKRLIADSRIESEINTLRSANEFLSISGYSAEKSNFLVKLASTSKYEDFKKAIAKAVYSACIKNKQICLKDFHKTTANFPNSMQDYLVKEFIAILDSKNIDDLIQNHDQLKIIFLAKTTDPELIELLASSGVRFGFSNLVLNFLKSNKVNYKEDKWLKYAHCNSLLQTEDLLAAEKCFSQSSDPWFILNLVYTKKLMKKSVNLNEPQIIEAFDSIFNSKNENLRNYGFLMYTYVFQEWPKIFSEAHIASMLNDYENGFIFCALNSQIKSTSKNSAENYIEQYKLNFSKRTLAEGMTNLTIQKKIKSSFGKNHFLVRAGFSLKKSDETL